VYSGSTRSTPDWPGLDQPGRLSASSRVLAGAKIPAPRRLELLTTTTRATTFRV
jgi:hypothetical protein